jgi:hypothetical protein
VVDSLKALDPKRPIREADIGAIVFRKLFDPGAAEQRTMLQDNAEHLGVF